ncbi:nuclear receptor coactivator 5-like [Neocloeon triangulifer]|uniref:nuclear receptor coactivator 5-like n=1 Tax=Neocloeon triangulifer TaxID=2078957 RepID=UPI00286F26AF|nr:nuclear receptor coactivator 5-like [Neocloeon triangulifer]
MESRDFNNPNTARSRICVKNTPSNSNQFQIKEELGKHFEKYGNILGILCMKGFTLIQFDAEEAASCAIQMENNTTFMGKMIKVTPARIQPVPPGDNLFRDRSPNRKRSPVRQIRGHSPPRRGRSPPRENRSPPRDTWRPRFNDDFSSEQYDNNPFNAPQQRFPPGPPGPAPAAPRPPPKVPNAAERTNDCEILIFDRAQTIYGETIEQKLKNLGLSADILFPNASIPVGRLLASIANKGTLYAINVYPINEVKESFTVNILQGDSEEHRNIPFEQGINVIMVNFDKYIQNGGSRTAPALVPMVGSSGPSIHPDAIQTMTNLLLQNRPLTVMQYDAFIKYLDHLKTKQAKLEIGDALSVTMEVAKPDNNPAEDLLKNRIMSIMDKTLKKPPELPMSSALAAPPMMKMPPMPQMPNLPASATPMLQDPNIQKALDALLSGGSLNFF